MGLFNSKPKQQLKDINGYIIDELTGMLVDVPIGLHDSCIITRVWHIKLYYYNLYSKKKG